MKKPPFFIYILIFSIATTMAVLFTPALPDLTRGFSLEKGQAQWAMTIYLFGFAFGQLIYGPLANGWGRKKALYFGFVLALIGTSISFFAGSFLVFCLGRLFQALGAAAGLKIIFTMMGDLYSKEKAVKAISYLMIGFGIAQGIGPAVGGFLTVYFGWRGCFGFLILYTLLLFALSFLLPETADKIDKNALKFPKILSGYLSQFKDSFTVYHALLMGLSTASLYIFQTEAPFIGIEVIGLKPDTYGLFAIFIALGMLTGTLSGNRIAGKVLPRVAILSGIILALFTVIVMANLFGHNIVNGWTLFISFYFIQIGVVIVWLFASSKGLSEATDKANASAVMQFINMGVVTVLTLLVGAFAPKIPGSLPIAFGLLALLQLLIWFRLKAHHARSP